MNAGKQYVDWHMDEKSDPRSISINEYVLWKDFKNGDLAAYSIIYRKYFFVLYNYGKKLSSDHELIKDCIQDLFIKIWSNRENLTDTTSIKYYLFTSLKRKLLDALKTPHLKMRVEQDFLNDEVINRSEDTEHHDDDAMVGQREKVLKALDRLSKHQQKLLHLKFEKNLSNREIANELGITIQSVYNAVFKALRSVRKKLPVIITILFFIHNAH